jgi:unsaturated chondroitin disaccharide hydrolase
VFGVLELAGVGKEENLKEKYIEAAASFIEKLSSKNYFSGDVNQALLLHSTGHYPKNSEIDVPIIYADYYFMEAMMRLKKLRESNDKVALAK